MTSTYNITREQAAESLWISTRTLDRYIKKWKLTYKKVANRVLLSTDELSQLREDFASIKQDMHYFEVIWNWDTKSENSTSIVDYKSNTWLNNELKDLINTNFQNFFHLLKEKDLELQSKNELIFNMQTKMIELENKLRNTIALPDYTKEKENITIEKEKLSLENETLNEQLKKQKLNNIFVMVLFICSIAFIAFWIFSK